MGLRANQNKGNLIFNCFTIRVNYFQCTQYSTYQTRYFTILCNSLSPIQQLLFSFMFAPGFGVSLVSSLSIQRMLVLKFESKFALQDVTAGAWMIYTCRHSLMKQHSLHSMNLNNKLLYHNNNTTTTYPLHTLRKFIAVTVL